MEYRFDDKTIRQIFGFEDAESEDIKRLKEYYFKTKTYERVTSDLPVCILVGHKGIGKSALFKVAFSEDLEKNNLPIIIKPDDIAELGKSDENFLLKIRQWKHGLRKIIGQKVFERFGILNTENNNKLNLFGTKLVSFIIDTIAPLKTSLNLDSSNKFLLDNFLKNKRITVYIDDLDRGWEGKSDDISRISALLNCIRDMTNENPGISFKISLRTDVYFLVRTSDESTDKIESSVIWFTWKNYEILLMLIKRISTFLGKDYDESKVREMSSEQLSNLLSPIFYPKFNGAGKWYNKDISKVLMSLVRKRPRDLIKLCTLAAQEADSCNKNRIETKHLSAVFESYSQGRMQDTINEYRTELPDIERLLFGMKPTKKNLHTADSFYYTTNKLITKIKDIASMNNFVFKDRRKCSEKDLAHFLYKINFLTARKDLTDGYVERKYFEENRYLSSKFVDFGYNWEVHPAFRWALQTENANTLIDTISDTKNY